MRLHDLPRSVPATIASIDWAALGEREGRRLRELGVDEGVTVESLHRAPFGGDPITCRIGRMTVAMRRATASAIMTEALSEEDGTSPHPHPTAQSGYSVGGRVGVRAGAAFSDKTSAE